MKIYIRYFIQNPRLAADTPQSLAIKIYQIHYSASKHIYKLR
jgi:hypothetical protein